VGLSSSNGKPQGRAIVTYSRSWQALAAIRSLGRRGVEVIAADEYSVTPGKLSRYSVDSFQYPSPVEDPDGFLAELEQAVRRYKTDGPLVLMAIHRETYLIAAARQRFEPDAIVPLADKAKFEQVQNKGRLAEYARRQGITVPRTWVPKNGEHIVSAADAVRYPAFLKLPESASGVGIVKVNDRQELIATYRAMVEEFHLHGSRRPIVQEMIEGDDYCVTGLWDRGELKIAMTYRNVLSYPREQGPGAVRETIAAPKLEALAAELLGGLGWHGMAQVDYRWTGNDEDPAYLLEVNPRFFGGLYQAIESGVDYPYLLFQLATGRPLALPEAIDYGVRTEAPVISLLATLSELGEHESKLDELEHAWDDAKRQLDAGHAGKALRTILAGLQDSVDVEGRLEHVRRVLEDNADNVGVLFRVDDPLPVLGLVYPLAVFMRHGKLSKHLLAGGSAEQAGG